MNRNILLIIGAAVVAIIVAIVASSLLSKPEQASTPKVGTEVLVANKLLMTGQKLKAEDVRWQSWSDDALYNGLIKKSDQPDAEKLSVYDSPLRHDIESGEPITTQALVTNAKGDSLSAFISPGMRAMAVAVRANTGAGGFVAPGDHVDVILAYAAKLVGKAQDAAPPIVQRVASQIILSNVKVLAVDQNAKDNAHEAKEAKTVTLEVDQLGEAKLALAQQMGDLSLSLRRLGDKDDPNAPPPPIVTDVNSIDVIKKINSQLNQSDNKYVRLYNGGDVQNVPVRSAPNR